MDVANGLRRDGCAVYVPAEAHPGRTLPRVRLGDSKRDWVKPADVKRLIDRSTVNNDG
jgi:hypothetical protein